MGDKTGIAWTDATWNPIAGCSLVSPGCTHCYAMNEAHRLGERLGQEKYRGLTKAVNGKPVWTGDVRLWPAALDQPLRWKRPRRIFVNSMSDLFHESLRDEAIDRIFAVMACAYWHTFQVLTKRPDRMYDYLTGHAAGGRHIWAAGQSVAMPHHHPFKADTGWPLPNVWLGVSAEDQQRADERIPLLLQTPAAVRFVSYEPALGPIDFRGKDPQESALDPYEGDAKLDWIIIGGESGANARPFDVAWARSTVEQCRAAGVACFVKQMGRRVHGSAAGFRVDRYIAADGSEWVPPIIGFDRQRFEQENAGRIVGFKVFNRAGADPSEWPEDLRVQEFPRSAV